MISIKYIKENISRTFHDTELKGVFNEMISLLRKQNQEQIQLYQTKKLLHLQEEH